jgi:hypothetical protein
VRDADELKDLKREYLDLVGIHGEEVTEFKAFKRSLLDMSRRHRHEAIGMYLKMLSRIEKKVSRGR